MSNMPGYNPEGLGIQFGEALLEAEQKRRAERRAEITKEEAVLVRRLCQTLVIDEDHVRLMSLRALAICIRDGVVTRADLVALEAG